ncbi:MAG: CHASE3 domain-containing protein [Sphingomonas sp.]|uniref:sensor histidine kinase n=1 Tax=Sphingomonas sp. TaxID=28214 RepID=UPI001AC6066A|nr:sensor histidine kinase [Sphingomonas sp.]MBN8809070.1 CHASE3 domain-containing protein [Sphingomonas sp.]
MSGVILQRLGAPEGIARRFLVTCMIVGFAALMLAGVAAVWVNGKTAEHTRWVNHTYDVELAIDHTRVLIEQAETTRRGYLLTGLQPYLDAERETVVQIDPAIDRLAAMTTDNPRQNARIAALRHNLATIRQLQDTSISQVGTGQRDAAIAAFTAETTNRRMRAVRNLFATMSDDERALLRVRDAAQSDSIHTFYLVLAAAGALILFVALISLMTVLRYMRDLDAARDRLQRLNSNLEGAVAERTADLTRANEEIQRFAYIVSHDLRSPLVNVMGFTAELDAARGTLADFIARTEAEAPHLVDADARIAATEDLPEAIGFIRTSTQKMDRLINAILRLSREGRRVLVPERLALADVAGTVRDTLRHLADDRGAEIVIDSPLPTLVSDRVAIEQVLSNLIENAVKYLSSDRAGRIVVRARAQGARRIVEVADNGRGIAEQDHARIFDLFRRSGAQDQPGEGIGLAHVRALVYRLGGTIDVTSILGQGSTFRVNLPETLDTGTTA